MSVVRKLVGLRRIVLSETAVTTSGISELGILPRLERISIYRGDRLTVGLVDVLAGFDALKRVELVSIPCVSQASVERLRTERPAGNVVSKSRCTSDWFVGHDVSTREN